MNRRQPLGAHGNSHKTRLRYRRIDNAIGAELFDKAGQYFERRACFGHVLTYNKDGFITAHFFCQGFVDGLG